MSMSPRHRQPVTHILATCLLAAALQACSSDAGNGASGGAPAAAGSAGSLPGAGGSAGASAPAAGTAGAVPATAGGSEGGSISTASSGASGGGGMPRATGGMAAGAAAGSGGGTAGVGGAAAGPGGSGGDAGTPSGGGAQAVTCPAVALAPGNVTRNLQSKGRSREYVLHVPSGYKGTAAVPLLVDFHGHGGTGTTQQKDSPYPKVVDAENVIMAFPTAVGDWNIGPCCADDVDDLGFAKDLVAAIEKLACIDPKRVYAAGFSMGGGMSHQLACQDADVFAAVAPAAFDLLEENLPTCKPKRPITVISFRGSGDSLAPYNGGLSNLVRPINFLGAISSMKKWGELNGCTGAAADLGNNCQGYAAAQCPGGVEVIECTKAGGGHEQGNATLGWPVLKRHQLP